MRRSILVEWESDDRVPPIGSQSFFKLLGSLADLVSDFPSDVTVTYDGVAARRVGGRWADLSADASTNAPINPAVTTTEDLTLAEERAYRLTVLDLLYIGFELRLISREHVNIKTVSRAELVPLLFSRAKDAQVSSSLAQAIRQEVEVVSRIATALERIGDALHTSSGRREPAGIATVLDCVDNRISSLGDVVDGLNPEKTR